MSSPSSRSGVADGPSPVLNELLEEVELIDHHVHSVARGTIAPREFVAMISESDRQSAADAAGMDTQLGIAIRRWCGPLLGLERSAPAEAYLEVRCGRSNEEVASLLLPAAGFERLLVDTGHRGDELVGLDELGRMADAPVDPVVRLEALAEAVAADCSGPAAFAPGFREVLARESAGAVGLKTIVAYRHGLDFDPSPPTDAEVGTAVERWLRVRDADRAVARLTDPVVLRFIIWEGARTGLPLQVHAGYGDPDLDLHRADPLLLTEFLRATEDVCPVLLLHNYPFHRNAGYLAQMFHHVFLDVGLAVNHTGAQSAQLIAESLEVAPLTKVLFSSDAWGAPELHLLGSWLFRRGMARVIGSFVAAGDWSPEDARRAVALVGSENARRVYRLDASRRPRGVDA